MAALQESVQQARAFRGEAGDADVHDLSRAKKITAKKTAKKTAAKKTAKTAKKTTAAKTAKKSTGRTVRRSV
ncbi:MULTISPECIES: hypothetical protein [Streptomyces]|jgi:DNA end-binding protein Ku|uniref:DNA-binding protein n=1 Tax=Streptomyces spinosisporus TaxID=2927582 RepID=A0ABS9XXA0_9ACTN|nr:MULTISPECIES: hypothetical protein [Streptomyces]MCI3246520.1 hypothetical protein [Streptomyces spinosisporus]WUB33416.1 hypothetical protein OHN38_00165 [Streptomyces sp. NBC_00588]WUB41353.1 hypothetical protein OHN38_43135 [Streptomyces sp. NBC_00588]